MWREVKRSNTSIQGVMDKINLLMSNKRSRRGSKGLLETEQQPNKEQEHQTVSGKRQHNKQITEELKQEEATKPSGTARELAALIHKKKSKINGYAVGQEIPRPLRGPLEVVLEVLKEESRC